MVTQFIPLFTDKNIKQIISFLKLKVPNESYEVIETKGVHLCWINMLFDQPQTPNWHPDIATLKSEIKELIKPWEDKLQLGLKTEFLEKESIYIKYILAFPPHHRIRRTPQETIRDIIYLEKLESAQKIQFNLVPFSFQDSLLHHKASILFIYNNKN